MCFCPLSKILGRFFRFLWSLFLNGLLTILPITFTIVIFTISFRLITNWLEPIKNIQPEFLKKIPYAEVILAILAIFLLGTILKIFILKRIIHIIENVISKIPLIRPIYNGIKQLVKALSGKSKLSFKQVVVIEFPRRGIFCIGFLTSELPTQIAPENGQKYFNIYMPTAPNPTSGYYIILPEKDIRKIDLTRQEAMAMVISGGIVQPDRFKQKK
ncbi:DUF502 domain-containing protein [Candidatus Dependentiae bacterium]